MGKDERQRSSPVALSHRNELHLTRKIFHAFNGSLMFAIYQCNYVDWQVGAALLVPWVILAWAVEIGRLKSTSLNKILIKYTGKIMRAGEVNKPSGICFFLTGVLIAGALILPDKNALLLSLLYLGLGDPFASACGILSRPYVPSAFQLSNGKSLVGTVCDIAFCTGLTYLFLIWRFSAFYFTSFQFWSYVIGGGLAGGISETFLFGSFMNTYLNDNLTIPILCSITLKLIGWGVGADLN